MKYWLFAFAVIAAGCAKSDADLLREAREAHQQKQFQLAASKYEELAARGGAAAYAESSLTALALLYTNDLQDYGGAASAYRRCAARFPQSPHAPSMLFLAGFLYNNDLHRIDSARAIYEEFLVRYPADSLAPSARFELQYLGRDPEAILAPRAGEGEQSAEAREEAPKTPAKGRRTK